MAIFELQSFSKKEFEEAMARLEADPPATYWPPQNYPQYLRSRLWKLISRRVLERDDRMCLRCGNTATEVHHRRYTPEALAGEDDSVLVSLCRSCHFTVHYESPRKPRPSWNEQERILLEPPDGLTPATPQA